MTEHIWSHACDIFMFPSSIENGGSNSIDQNEFSLFQQVRLQAPHEADQLSGPNLLVGVGLSIGLLSVYYTALKTK